MQVVKILLATLHSQEIEILWLNFIIPVALLQEATSRPGSLLESFSSTKVNSTLLNFLENTTLSEESSRALRNDQHTANESPPCLSFSGTLLCSDVFENDCYTSTV